MTGAEWIVLTLAAAFVGLSKGGFAAVGSIAVPVAALVMSPVQAAGLLLPVYVVSDAFGVWAWRRSFDRRVLAILIPGSIVGIALGWAMASRISDTAVGAMIGVIGAVFAIRQLWPRKGAEAAPRPARVGPGLFWGALAGFTSFVSHSGAPPYQVYVQPLRLSAQSFAGTTTLFFAATNAVKLIPYAALGQLAPANFGIMAVLAVPAVICVFVGRWAVRVIPQRTFFLFINWALLLVSIELIWRALR